MWGAHRVGVLLVVALSDISYLHVWRFAKLIDDIENRLGATGLLAGSTLEKVKSEMPEMEGIALEVYQRFREQITELRRFYSQYVAAGLKRDILTQQQCCHVMMMVMKDLSIIRGERISKRHFVALPREVEDLRSHASRQQDRREASRRVYHCLFRADCDMSQLKCLENVVHYWLNPQNSPYRQRLALFGSEPKYNI